MDRIVLYHNPNCSKSRGALDLLQERGVDFEVVEYLTAPVSAERLGQLIELLPDPAGELVRKDRSFKQLGLDPADYEAPEAVVAVLVEHPELMQRPIAVRGRRAVIGRPTEKVLELLD